MFHHCPFNIHACMYNLKKPQTQCKKLSFKTDGIDKF